MHYVLTSTPLAVRRHPAGLQCVLFLSRCRPSGACLHACISCDMQDGTAYRLRNKAILEQAY